MRILLVAALVTMAGCSGGSDDIGPGVDAQFTAPRLGESCEAGDPCGDRATCEGGTCTIACGSSADCPQFATCTDGPGGVRGCFWFCQSAADCPTTAPICTGSGFGFCES